MANKVKPVPEGYRTITPYLYIKGATAAIEFYQKVFAAKERMRMGGPDGKVGHAEIEIGGSVIMLADEHPEMNVRGPQSYGGTPVSLLLYVEDVDATINKAVASGAKIVRPIENKFYGDRSGGIEDPFGHVWHVATHIEDVSPEEMQKRAAALFPEKK